MEQVAPTEGVGVTGVAQDVQPKLVSLDEPGALGSAGDRLCPAAPQLCSPAQLWERREKQSQSKVHVLALPGTEAIFFPGVGSELCLSSG